MKYNIAITIFFVLTSFFSASGQVSDSTNKFKLYPLESVSIENTFDGEVTFKSESKRSSLLILDQQIRHFLLTVNLIEYKFGKKIKESNIFSRIAINDNSKLKTFEDSSMLFSLYRKQIKDNEFLWGFRTPSALYTQTIHLDDKEEFYVIIAIPQNFLNNKIPLGKPFPLLVITSPDKTRNYPFALPENKYPVNEWSNKFQLNHTFVVELTIEKADDKNLSDNGVSL
jgi:hypothetical protein